MADRVKAALTASEWKAVEGLQTPFVYDIIFGRGKTDGEYRHAHAAVALHGQPFGFTRADVVACWAAVNYVDDLSARRFASLADRLAALLPPEPTDG